MAHQIRTPGVCFCICKPSGINKGELKRFMGIFGKFEKHFKISSMKFNKFNIYQISSDIISLVRIIGACYLTRRDNFGFIVVYLFKSHHQWLFTFPLLRLSSVAILFWLKILFFCTILHTLRRRNVTFKCNFLLIEQNRCDNFWKHWKEVSDERSCPQDCNREKFLYSVNPFVGYRGNTENKKPP